MSRLLTVSLALVMLSGCSRHVRLSDIQGEWAADSACLYLKVQDDSVMAYGLDSGLPVDQDPAFNPAHITWRNKLILERKDGTAHMVGVFVDSTQGPWIRLPLFSHPLRLRRLVSDSSTSLKALQFSVIGCFFGGRVFDMDCRHGEVLLVEHIPSGPWNGFSDRWETFTRPLPESEFAKLECELRKGFLREERSQCSRQGRREPEWGTCGLVVFSRDTSFGYRFSSGFFPPEFTPFLIAMHPILQDSSHGGYSKRPDTSVVFKSRLASLFEYQDSLIYLESVDPLHYHSAQFPGGDYRFSEYITSALAPPEGREIHVGVYVTVGPDGTIENVRVPYWGLDKRDGLTSDEVNAYLDVIKHSPPWEIPLYDGKPTRVERLVMYFSRGRIVYRPGS